MKEHGMASRRFLLTATGLVSSLATVLIATSALVATPAEAQYFPRPYLYGGFYSAPIVAPLPRRPVGMAAEDIIDELESRGYRAVTIAHRRRDVVVVDALDPRRQPVRLVVDAFDGEILERFARQGRDGEGARDVTGLPAPGGTSQGLNPDMQRRERNRVAEIPTPPRRPAGDAVVAPGTRPAPVAPARPSSEWLPADLAPKQE
jgi:hypothetical protein